MFGYVPGLDLSISNKKITNTSKPPGKPRLEKPLFVHTVASFKVDCLAANPHLRLRSMYKTSSPTVTIKLKQLANQEGL